ncbi:hypothetical protein HELRODRAFT_168777 [Helobdella robusta]|uniref:Sushi domain-containing protein n=1 Tax=Helobdella robusta TaxID=6412 RepID=T1F0Y3_HELRO|nr:hypothetical protein HELRODRAFT_168777 [Helobdella robusta]ESO08861.1 hypothetical protein HELRODRAFT_168777 [Helobdella robusta]
MQYTGTNDCPDLYPPHNGWVVRSGNNMTLYCNNTAEIWHLTCSKNRWDGKYRNCTDAIGSAHNGDSLSQTVQSYPVGIFVAVTIGIALGVFCGLLLLSAVICCQKQSNVEKKPINYLAYDIPNKELRQPAEPTPNMADQRLKNQIVPSEKFYYDVSTNQHAGPICSCAIGRNFNFDPAYKLSNDDSSGQTHLNPSLSNSPCLAAYSYSAADPAGPMTAYLLKEGGVNKSDVIVSCEGGDENSCVIDANKPYMSNKRMTSTGFNQNNCR